MKYHIVEYELIKLPELSTNKITKLKIILSKLLNFVLIHIILVLYEKYN